MNHFHVPEEILVDIWKNQRFEKEIFTELGEKIEVIYVGDENKEHGGPDFTNARVKIGHMMYVGDIEIDNMHADWKNHGHNVNQRFNKVILHAIVNNESNQKIVYTQDGRRINTFCFAPHLSEKDLNTLKTALVIDDDKKTHKVHCFKVIDFANDQFKIDYLANLGLSRFKKKSEKLVHRLRELLYIQANHINEPELSYNIPEEVLNKPLTADELNQKQVWEQLFYEGLFEALGYSQNKTIMNKLAVSVPIQFLYSLNIPRQDATKILESIYFHVSGLIPNHTKITDGESLEYIAELKKEWLKYKQLYDGNYYSEIDWHFFKLRPQNFPTIRLAAGARLAQKLMYNDLISTILRKFTEIHNLFVLKNSVRSLFIVKGEGYWTKHYNFGKVSGDEIRYFLGNSRADEIFQNVVLPFVYVYFDLFNKRKLAEKTLQLFSEIDCDAENSLVKEVAESLHLENSWKKSVIYQGMIELFRSFCSKEKCAECVIGQKVFVNDD